MVDFEYLDEEIVNHESGEIMDLCELDLSSYEYLILQPDTYQAELYENTFYFFGLCMSIFILGFFARNIMDMFR